MHALDHGFITERGATRPHLQLTASIETVMGLPGAPGGDLEFAGAVPAATVQRLACDASIRRVLCVEPAAQREAPRYAGPIRARMAAISYAKREVPHA